ncbi:MAG: phosphoribosylamine--glycine ligase [Phycisphaerales bacterium]|nr:MAG: phosphoribosylamine--glycine ligase [Phycisphaerales bacterium]
MRVMVIGGGGREHTLAYGLARSKRVNEVICVPGNAGTAAIAENIDAKVDDHDALVAIARDRGVDLTVVGPEAPLCAGIVDRFKQEGLRIFGPSAAAARLEGDKAYAKHLMNIAKIPTAEARIFDRFDAAKEYVATRETGVVVKASGLAAGKGVYVCDDPADALRALESIMVERVFGDAGSVVVVEELLKGQELSVLALVDGQTIYMLESSQDHKPIGDGDTGPNTGGMGAYSPAPIATPEVMSKVEREVLVPIVDALRNDGAPYCGVLYAGLMITAAGPKVLEFNCRFGDPEAQAVLFRLESDLFDLLEVVVEGRLAEVELRWNPKPAVCVVMASDGYPGSYESGKVIDGLDRASTLEDVYVFHAGTKKLEHLALSSGGRVLGVTALGSDIADAKQRAYTAVETIDFENKCYRCDIADKAIKAGALG